jgi:prepilin-type N-terminal cleavage/methylation domain-containing protein
MRLLRRSHRRHGFTLFELLIVIALISIMATMAIPNFLRLIQRSKLTGIAQESALLVRMARDYAIRYNTEAIVRIDLDTDEIIAFVDVDGELPGDPADRIFNPIAGQPYRATDFELARYRLPSHVTFAAPAADPLAGEGSGRPVWMFTEVNGERVAVFHSNGGTEERGAFRFADPHGNYLQVRVDPKTTGRVRIEKFHDEDVEWYFRNENNKPWEWK